MIVNAVFMPRGLIALHLFQAAKRQMRTLTTLGPILKIRAHVLT